MGALHDVPVVPDRCVCGRVAPARWMTNRARSWKAGSRRAVAPSRPADGKGAEAYRYRALAHDAAGRSTTGSSATGSSRCDPTLSCSCSRARALVLVLSCSRALVRGSCSISICGVLYKVENARGPPSPHLPTSGGSPPTATRAQPGARDRCFETFPGPHFRYIIWVYGSREG